MTAPSHLDPISERVVRNSAYEELCSTSPQSIQINRSTALGLEDGTHAFSMAEDLRVCDPSRPEAPTDLVIPWTTDQRLRDLAQQVAFVLRDPTLVKQDTIEKIDGNAYIAAYECAWFEAGRHRGKAGEAYPPWAEFMAPPAPLPETVPDAPLPETFLGESPITEREREIQSVESRVRFKAHRLITERYEHDYFLFIALTKGFRQGIADRRQDDEQRARANTPAYLG